MTRKHRVTLMIVILGMATFGPDLLGSGASDARLLSDKIVVDDVAIPSPVDVPSKPSASPPQAAVDRPYVRAGYVIPGNRTEQPRAVETIRYVILTYRNWLRDQMQQHGQGPKTFVYETQPDGVTPKVHLIHVSETDAYLREDIWGNTLTAVTNSGVALWQPGEVWLLFVETHTQSPDGRVEGGAALGASWGSGDDPGVAMIGGNGLAVLRPEFCTDDRTYHNQVLPEVGPYPLQQDVSFAWFEGNTFSSVHSSYLGAGMHELGHAFGLPHDFRNDENFHGNLMGNGFRGFRGCVHPGRYPDDFARLSHAAALVFGRSRYCNAGRADKTRPTVSVSTQGSVPLVDGLLPIRFHATDDKGLGTALLIWEGDVIGEMMMSGRDASPQFTTAYFELGASKRYTVVAFDLEGNRASQEVAITATGKDNSAPRPFVKITPPLLLPGESFVLDASNSSDPDQSSSGLQVEWDLNGDGVFDTPPSTTKTLPVTQPILGPLPILARLRDNAGNSTSSTPIFIAPHLPDTAMVAGSAGPAIEWDSALGFTYQVQRSGTLRSWSEKLLPLIYGDGFVQHYEPPTLGTLAEFFRLRLAKRQQ
jgi:hypothetical protein